MTNLLDKIFWKDIKELNTIGLNIFYDISKQVRSKQKDGLEDYENLFLIFFHDIQRLLSACLQRNYELKNEHLRIKKFNNFNQKDFPFFDYQNLLEEKIDINQKKILKDEFHYRISFFHKIINFASCFFDKRLLYMNTHLDTRDILSFFLKRRVGIFFANSQKLFATDKMFSGIEEIKTYIIDYLRDYEIVIQGLDELVESYFLQYLTKEQVLYNQDLVILGTLGKTANRLIACNAARQGLKVMMLRHGESDGVIDEPIMGYCEQSFADYFVCFGNFDIESIQNSNFLEGHGKKRSTNIINTNSEIIKRIYSSKIISPISNNLKDLKITFVPTFTGGFNTYLPYRYIPENYRNQFFIYLKELLPSMKFKSHIKDKEGLLEIFESKDLLDMTLIQSLKYTDVFIFDYVSTAFSEIAATDKQIIFLDIGARNLTKKGIKLISERCHYIDLQSVGFGSLQETLEKLELTKKINNFSEEFSLINSNEHALETIFKKIKHVL